MPKVHLCGYDQLSCVEADGIEPINSSAELLQQIRAEGVRRSLRSATGALGDHAITDGVVLDLKSLPDELHQEGWPRAIKLREIAIEDHADGSATARVGALVTWRQFVKATLKRGLIAPSVVTGPDITIGGSVSAGSISRFSHVWGLEHSSVVSIDALFPNGKLVTDIRADGPTTSDLYRAIIAGHGWIGVILSVTFRLRRVAVGSGDLTNQLVAETHVADKDRGRAGERSWWKNQLERLSLAGRVARDMLSQLPDRGWNAPIHDRLKGVYDAQSTVGFVTRDEMFAIRYASRFVQNPPERFAGIPIYDGPTPLRVLGELALSVPWMHEFAQLVFTQQLEKKRYHNAVDPFVFFFEGNTKVREIVNGKKSLDSLGVTGGDLEADVRARALRGLQERFEGYRSDQGLPGTMYAIQQTHLMPDVGTATDLLMYMHEYARAMSLDDRPTLFDLLYLPGDLRNPFLSTAGKHGGYAVTVAWQAIHPSADRMKEEQALAVVLADECARLGGKVSLLKNNYARPGIVRQGLDPKDLERFMLVKKWTDPKNVLRNPLFDRHFV
ncbi:MAG: FAD-binding oxidoreductase [Myxococcales bacterium]|nr:FAD-binding oxidoreductase [Myxococcales bacterium]